MFSKQMDVIWVDDPTMRGQFTCASLNVIRGWDGELYAETNIAELAGERVVCIDGPHEIPRIGEHRFNCGDGLLLWNEMWQFYHA